MKLTIKLTEQEVKQAISVYASDILGITVQADNVSKGPYSFDPYHIEIDTDQEQEIVSRACDKELERLLATKEAV